MRSSCVDRLIANLSVDPDLLIEAVSATSLYVLAIVCAVALIDELLNRI